jgi:hypothetical protein
MAGDPVENVLWVWTASELLVIAAFMGLLVASLTGDTTLFTSASRRLRLAGVAFLTVELLIPLWVFVDLRRRGESGSLWMHVAAMPGINIFGLFAYLQERKA